MDGFIIPGVLPVPITTVPTDMTALFVSTTHIVVHTRKTGDLPNTRFSTPSPTSFGLTRKELIHLTQVFFAPAASEIRYEPYTVSVPSSANNVRKTSIRMSATL